MYVEIVSTIPFDVYAYSVHFTEIEHPKIYCNKFTGV